MSKKPLLAFSLAASFCLTVGSLLYETGLSAQAAETWSYGDVTFGSEKYTGSSQVSTSSFSSTNVNVSNVTSSKCYAETSSGASSLRIGSSGSTGTITFTFASSYKITALRVLAYQYDGACGLTISDSSSYSSSQDVVATSGSTISECLSSSWLSYTGFSGDITSLTFSGVSARVNLAKFIVILDGASSYSSSSLASSGYSSSSASYSSNSSAPTSYSFSNTSGYYVSVTNTSYSGNYIDESPYSSFRVAPMKVNGDNASCYKVSQSGDTYEYYVAETLTRGGVYIDPNEVALYYNAFSSFPANYSHYTSSTLSSVKSSTYASYGSKARLYTEYDKTTGYVKAMPEFIQPSGFNYIEADIAVTSSYASSASWNRGSGRLVIFPSGTAQYNDGPFCVRTLDHYGHFREFSNSLEDWGDNFDGVDSSNNTFTDSYGSYSPLTTVSPVLAS